MRPFHLEKWRIAATSFLVQDEYIPAVRRIAPLVDEIALLVCDCTDPVYGLKPADVDELRRIGEDNGLAWNIHLPTTGDFDTAAHGRAYADHIARAIELTAPLAPHSWVMHVNGAEYAAMEPFRSTGEMPRWMHTLVNELAGVTPTPRHLCLENLEDQPMMYLDALVEEAKCSRCFDIGHVWKNHLDPRVYLHHFLPDIRMCHLHGMGARNHTSLTAMPHEVVAAFLHKAVSLGLNVPMTLEVFREEDFVHSFELLQSVFGEHNVHDSHPFSSPVPS